MTELKKKIHEMCPDGVPMVALISVADVLYGCPFDAKLFTDNDSYIPLIRIRDVVPGIPSTYYSGDYQDIYIIHKGDILVGMDGNFNLEKWKSDRNGVLCQRVCKIESNSKGLVLNNYLYHYLGPLFKLIEESTPGGSVKHLSAKTINQIQIPLPPLPIQQRIVEILDKFTSLVSSLDSEIALRQKQYEYYRNKLLSFEEGEEGVEWKYIGDIFTFKNGLNKGKDFFGHGGPIINYTDVYHNNGITAPILKGKVELSPLEIGRYLVHRGDVFFTRTSETPEEVGYASVLLEEIENCTFSGFLLRGRPEIDVLIPEYCKYCFSTYEVRKAIVNTCSFTTRATTTGGTLSKIRIPIPPKSVQLSIVRTLDTFESLLTNLKKERELRQKQYEYYREKLLTFA